MSKLAQLAPNEEGDMPKQPQQNSGLGKMHVAQVMSKLSAPIKTKHKKENRQGYRENVGGSCIEHISSDAFCSRATLTDVSYDLLSHGGTYMCTH
jgi:hypothetical protein